MRARTSDHGQRSRYVQGCRCDDCKSADRHYQAAYRARRRRNNAIPDERHGQLATYTNWGCRCDLCKQAMADYTARYRRR